MWKLTENKSPKNQQELQVAAMLKEMAQGSYATYAEQFKEHFKQMVKEIPRTNSFSAELMFQVTPRNQKSVEVWKMTVSGDFSYKMFTLDYIEAN